jgi:chromosome segregation ATPase
MKIKGCWWASAGLPAVQKDREDLSSKYQKIVEEKDNMIGHVHLEWEVAARKLLTELAEGDKVLIEAEKEMEEIVSDAWLLKNLLHSKSQHSSAESRQSLPEADVDEEQEYFGMIHLVEEDEIFSPQLQRSVPEDGFAPQEAQVAFKQKFRLESQIQQLELDLQKWQQEAQTAQVFSVEMEQLQKSLAELEREKSEMEVQIGLLKVQAQEATTSCKENIRLVSEAQRLELELAECQSQKSLELSILLEAKTNLREEIDYLELQLKSCQQRGEESQTALAVMAKDNLKLREEIELLSIQAQEATVLLAEKRELETDMVELELELKDSHRKKLAMRKEIKQLTLSLSEMECQNQCLASTVEMKTDFSVVEEENDALRHFVEKLEQDLKNCQQKLENTEIVHEELRRTVVSLHSELGQKVELELDTTTMAQSLYDKLRTNNVGLDMVVQQNFELETDLALKIGALEFLTEQLAEANIARQNTSRERDEMAVHVAALQATCALKNKQVQELQEEADKNSNELRTIIDNLESVSVENRASVTHYRSMADSFGQELEEIKPGFLKLQEELHSARNELAQLIKEKENELCAAQENEENLQIELCMVKEELATAQRLAAENKRAADDAIQVSLDICPDNTLFSSSSILFSSSEHELIEHGMHAFCLQELEDKALAMSVLQDDKEKLQEKMEMLQKDLVHKTELVQGLESYLRQMQEHMVEASDLQQEELLHANYQILELQAEVDQKTKEWTSLEEELMMTRITTAKVIHERDELRLQVKTSEEDLTISETESPMRSEALSTMEKEEQDDLKAQITSLERKVVFLESELQLKVEAMYLLKVELNAASLAAIDLTEESTGLKAHAADLEATKVALAAELKQNVDARCSLEAELRAARANASSLMEQNLKLNTKVAKLQAKLIASEREIEQRVAEVSSLDSELAAEKWMANPHHLTEESSVFHIESAKLENKSDPKKLLEDKLTSATVMALKMTDESTNSEAQIAAKKSVLKTQLQHRCQEIGTLEDQLKVARRTTSNIAEENGRLNAEVAELQSKIVASEGELEQKVAAQILLQAEIAATRLEMSHMDSELRAAKMTASNMTKENVGFIAQVAELQAKIIAKEREPEHRVAAKVILEDELVAARFTASHMEGEFSAARMTAADMAEENDKLTAQIAELQVKLEQQVEAQVLLDKELVPARLAVSHMTDENSKLKLQIAELERKIQAMRLTELRIGALEEELKAKEEAINCLEKKHLVTVQQKEALLENAEKKLIDMKSDKDRVSIELELLHKELMTLQSLPNCHETATVEAHKVSCSLPQLHLDLLPAVLILVNSLCSCPSSSVFHVSSYLKFSLAKHD